MTTLVVTHEVDDVDHWLASTQREDIFGPLGITARTFVDPERANHVGLVVEIPDMEAFGEMMASEAGAAAMKHDGVRRETMVTLVER
jgi:hypothetical protein